MCQTIDKCPFIHIHNVHLYSTQSSDGIDKIT